MNINTNPLPGESGWKVPKESELVCCLQEAHGKYWSGEIRKMFNAWIPNQELPTEKLTGTEGKENILNDGERGEIFPERR